MQDKAVNDKQDDRINAIEQKSAKHDTHIKLIGAVIAVGAIPFATAWYNIGGQLSSVMTEIRSQNETLRSVASDTKDLSQNGPRILIDKITENRERITKNSNDIYDLTKRMRIVEGLPRVESTNKNSQLVIQGSPYGEWLLKNHKDKEECNDGIQLHNSGTPGLDIGTTQRGGVVGASIRSGGTSTTESGRSEY